MQPQTRRFKDNAHAAVADKHLRDVLGTVGGFRIKRAAAVARLPEFDQLRDAAKAIKDHTLAHLDLYLERFESKVLESGGHVHWCEDAAQARETILTICRDAGAKVVAKGKSMVSEEIGLAEHLERHGLEPIETDLGEYILQLRKEPPSHIIAPAIHLSAQDVAGTFREKHTELPADRTIGTAPDLVAEARHVLRKRFLAADVGITGANLLIAETGATVIVTNEGNGDLSQILPRIHIVIAAIEKVVPTMEDAFTILRVLARSATGQEFSAYTTFSAGPRRSEDVDGPSAFHVVILDNGRSRLLGSEHHEVLRCIRCGACMNHCPIYLNIGGHAYGWVYPGPIGAVVNPGLLGLAEAGHLPNASSFCGRCEEVCPMRIPLPKLMRHWREKEFAEKLNPPIARVGLGLWAFLARRPALYHWGAGLAMRLLGLIGRGRGRFRTMPMADGWTRFRDLPAPQGRTFQSLWAEGKRHV